MENKKINYNIEILRILAMIFVLTLHLLANGGILNNLHFLTPNYFIAWILELTMFGSINYFAFISGYLVYRKKSVLGSLLYNWIITIFYSVVIASIVLLINNNLSLDTISPYLFPFINNYNWYFKAYVILCLIQPILYLVCNKTSKTTFTILLGILFIFNSLLPTFDIDFINIGEGYNAFWIINAYLIGAYLHRFKPLNKVKSFVLITIFILCTLSLIASKLYIGVKVYPLDNNYLFNQLTRFNTPIVLIMSICLFTLIMKIKVDFSLKISKLILFLSKSTFGIYLIHLHPLLWPIYEGMFAFAANLNPILFILFIILVVSLAYIILSLIDNIRSSIFKFLKIPNACNFIGNKINKLLRLN